MKKGLKLFSLFLVLVVLLVGCENNININNNDDDKSKHLVEIDYYTLNQKLDNEETFILEVVQTGCSNCTAFSPKFEKVLEKYDLKAFSLNISDLNSEDANKFLDEFKVDGTPTVIFFKEGKETSTLKRLVGNKSESQIESKLRSNGYIE